MARADRNDILGLAAAVREMAEEAALEVAQKITLDVHANVVGASPVDTGTFRAAWTGETPDKIGDEGVVENNTEYGPALLDGHSEQAPAGWLDAAVEAAAKL